MAHGFCSRGKQRCVWHEDGHGPYLLSTALCPEKGSSPWCGVSRDKREETFPRSQLGKKSAQCCGFLQPKLQMDYQGSRKACSLPVLTSASAGEISLGNLFVFFFLTWLLWIPHWLDVSYILSLYQMQKLQLGVCFFPIINIYSLWSPYNSFSWMLSRCWGSLQMLTQRQTRWHEEAFGRPVDKCLSVEQTAHCGSHLQAS